MFVLETGDKIQGDASSAAVIDYHVSGLQGSSLKNLANGQLAAVAFTDLYTSSGTDVAKTIVLVNTDTVTRTVNLYHKTSGATARRIIPKDTALQAGWALRLEGNNMQVIDTAGAVITAIDTSNIVSITGDTMTGELNMADNLMTRPKLKDYSIEVYNHGTRTTATTIDLEQGNIHTITVGASLALTFANPVQSGDAQTFLLEVTNGGAFTLTFPSSVDWEGGVGPSLTAAGVDVLTFYTRDGGTTWHGVVSMVDSR